MPAERRDYLHIGLLFFCVPLQYIISTYTENTESSRSYALSKLLADWEQFQINYFTWDSWNEWLNNIIGDDPDGESPAVEVHRFRSDEHFGLSTNPRFSKSPNIKYKVGQVIKHSKYGYRGVIIGWDETAKAPESWLKEMHGENHEWRNAPNYAVLIDVRDRNHPQMSYVVQENIELAENRIMHPMIDEYFESYEGSKYKPRPWLRTIYPFD